tara:strand:- start:17645 stop:17932 length:288 start_codon:yes stop_codon:yes gene_type:complete
MKIDWDGEITRIINAVLLAAFSYSIWLTLLPLFVSPTSPFVVLVAMMIGVGAALFSMDFTNFKTVPQFKPLIIGGIILPIWPVLRVFVLNMIKRK